MSRSDGSRDLRVAILGGGAAGICMAIRLKQSGFEDFVLLEKAEGLGGTWYHNRYPGCACDIQSHLYSFSFDLKPDWSKPYGPQAEILAYLEGLADRHGIRSHCRLGCGVASAIWDEASARWTVLLDSGERVEADVVVSGLGMFNELAWPEIEGVDSFEGTSFHSARWNFDHDLSGETVGVIGSAASAVQFVPEIVKQAGQVHLFQRTANWVLPKEDEPYTAEQLEQFRGDPSLPLAMRNEIFEQVNGGLTFSDPVAVGELEGYCLMSMQQVEDPELRAKLVPTHPFGCKRPLLSNDFYPAFNRPNLELVTEGIERITQAGIATIDGRTRPVDTLIFATGFAATKYLSTIDVTGRKGLRIDEAWSDGPSAYLGVTTAGFPNLFMLYGPNTNNGSLLTMIEWQVEYTLKLIQRIANEGLAWLDVKPGPLERFNEELQEAMGRVKAWNAGCNGYYRTPSGRIVTQWPGSMTDFHELVRTPDPAAFEVAVR